MFEEDLAALSTADLLESAAWHRALANRADARLLEHAQLYADRFHPDVCPVRPGRRTCDGRERAVVLGGDGCPEIAEFAVAEFGAMLGVSPRVGAAFIGEALALRHRFPFTWARVQAGEATPWKARRIAADCSKLTLEAARYVDKRVAPLVDSITPYRLEKIVRAAKHHIDPGLARAEAETEARERGVFVGHSDAHGTKTVFIKTPSGAVIRHDATIADIAEALKTFGDTRPLQHRRADAVGIIADPRYTEELLAQARNHRLSQPNAAAPTPAATDTHAATGHPDTTAANDTTDRPGTTRAQATARRTDTDADADDDLLSDWASEPGPDTEADRHAPHPSSSDLPDPLDHPGSVATEPFYLDVSSDPADSGGEPLNPAAHRALHARLAQIKHQAHTTTDGASLRLRPGKTEIYVHLTDHTLATGTGILRAESLGPLLASQLTELVGHSPYVVKPVIDLNDGVSVHAYEIPERIRERVKLANPVELFPFGTRETNRTIDLDHIQPYDPLGPPDQTSTQNLAPLSRFGHRVKTHARGWNVRRIDHKTLEWSTPHGFIFEVGPNGTHRVQHE